MFLTSSMWTVGTFSEKDSKLLIRGYPLDSEVRKGKELARGISAYAAFFLFLALFALALANIYPWEFLGQLNDAWNITLGVIYLVVLPVIFGRALKYALSTKLEARARAQKKYLDELRDSSRVHTPLGLLQYIPWYQDEIRALMERHPHEVDAFLTDSRINELHDLLPSLSKERQRETEKFLKSEGALLIERLNELDLSHRTMREQQRAEEELERTARNDAAAELAIGIIREMKNRA